MTTTRTITICQDGDDLARRAAALFQDEARAAIAERGRFVVALSGGSTPEKTYGLLAQPETAAKIEWDKVFCFINDERFVNPEDANSNFGMVRRTLLSHVPLPASNIFPVATDSPTVEQAAADYETKIAEFFGAAPPNPPPAFDLIFLGAGRRRAYRVAVSRQAVAFSRRPLGRFHASGRFAAARRADYVHVSAD